MGNIVSFVDETAITYQADDWDTLKKTSGTDFANIINWFDSKLPTININKTNFLPFACY